MCIIRAQNAFYLYTPLNSKLSEPNVITFVHYIIINNYLIKMCGIKYVENYLFLISHYTEILHHIFNQNWDLLHTS